MQPKYIIERHEHGWLVRGAFPVQDILWLMRLVPEDGIADGLVAKHTGAVMALASLEGSKAWRKALGLAPETTK